MIRHDPFRLPILVLLAAIAWEISRRIWHAHRCPGCGRWALHGDPECRRHEPAMCPDCDGGGGSGSDPIPADGIGPGSPTVAEARVEPRLVRETATELQFSDGTYWSKAGLDYNLGRKAATRDIEARRGMDEWRELYASADWLRGYNDVRAAVRPGDLVERVPDEEASDR